MNSNKYICELPRIWQYRIKRELFVAGLSAEDIKRALNSKLSDLSDTIDISQFRELII